MSDRDPTDRTLRDPSTLDGLRFDARGLVPVVAQDARSGRVLMVAWADREALELSLSTGEMHFWSRSRGELWRKGATSGNALRLRSLHGDCDGDTVLAFVDPTGPACHTGETSCFGAATLPEEATPAARTDGDPDAGGSGDVVDRLWAVIRERARERPDGSYTARLLDDENLRLKKLGEEAAELIVAAARREPRAVAREAADLLYHTLVVLRGAGSSWDEVRDELDRRRRQVAPR